MGALSRIGFLVVCSLLSLSSGARELILAFDEPLLPSSALDGVARTQLLVSQLKQVDVKQAIVVVKTARMDDKNRRRLAIYDKANHVLVNGGHNTALYSKADLYRYEVSLLKADRWLAPYSNYSRRVSFEPLNEHGQLSLQKSLHAFLSERGYRSAFLPELPAKAVGDYLNYVYQRAHQDNRRVDMAALSRLYIEEVVSNLSHESAALYGLLGYSPPQVLRLSVNDLTVYTLVDLIDRLTEEGWTIKPAHAVLQTPLVNPVGKASWGEGSYIKTLLGGLYVPVTGNTRALGADKARINAILAQEYPALIERLSRDSLESLISTH